MPSIIAVGFLSVLPSLSGSRYGGWAVGSIASLRDDPRLSALKDTTQMHDQMGHHAADGALALVLACVVPDLGRNDFFTSVRTCAWPPPRPERFPICHIHSRSACME